MSFWAWLYEEWLTLIHRLNRYPPVKNIERRSRCHGTYPLDKVIGFRTTWALLFVLYRDTLACKNTQVSGLSYTYSICGILRRTNSRPLQARRGFNKRIQNPNILEHNEYFILMIYCLNVMWSSTG